MKIRTDILYTTPTDFFDLIGHAVMKLSPDAALGVCKRATDLNLVIIRIEGGIWHNPGFEARIDCIWDGADLLGSHINIAANNINAFDFIHEERTEHNAFILSISKTKQTLSKQQVGAISVT